MSDPNLLSAAGFTGAAAQNKINSSTAQGAIQQSQLGLSGEQQRTQINSAAEDRGMYNSSQRARDLGWQSAEQQNKSQLIDLGVQSDVNDANLSVAQELAQQQVQAQQLAQQKALFDQEMLLKQAQLYKETGGGPLDYGAINSYMNSPTNATNALEQGKNNAVDVITRVARGW